MRESSLASLRREFESSAEVMLKRSLHGLAAGSVATSSLTEDGLTVAVLLQEVYESLEDWDVVLCTIVSICQRWNKMVYNIQ